MIDSLGIFGGVGGWDLHDYELDICTTSLEKDPTAQATAVAAHTANSSCVDVTEYQLSPGHPYQLLKGSPPCGPFTVAGKGAGRSALELLLWAIEFAGHNMSVPRVIGVDAESQLVLEPLRLIIQAFDSYAFESVALEQTREVQPIWDAYAVVLRKLGYSVATGVVSAEQYGVPQTRKRAVLLASRIREVALPKPTHTRFRPNTTPKQDPGTHWYRTMSDALGIRTPAPGAGLRSNYGTGGDASKRGFRQFHEPAPTITRKYNRNKWVLDGKPIRAMTDKEAALLQTFPEDYPWQGTKTQVQLQIGNAIPPRLAKVLLQQVI